MGCQDIYVLEWRVSGTVQREPYKYHEDAEDARNAYLKMYKGKGYRIKKYSQDESGDYYGVIRVFDEELLNIFASKDDAEEFRKILKPRYQTKIVPYKQK